MRNLKHTYKNIKDNNKKTSTGRGRINWEWFDIMEDIFREDKTINIGATISSMVSSGNQINNVEQCTLSPPSTVSYEEEQQTISSNCLDTEVGEEITDDGSSWCVKTFDKHVSFKTVKKTNNLDNFINNSLYSPTNFYISDWIENCAKFKFCSYMENENTQCKYGQSINNHVINKYELFDCYSQTISSVPSTSTAPDNIPNDLSKENRKSKKQKNIRAKALYDIRKKQLDCEERRVNAINELKEAIKEHNVIQKERNEILQQLVQNRINQ